MCIDLKLVVQCIYAPVKRGLHVVVVSNALFTANKIHIIVQYTISKTMCPCRIFYFERLTYSGVLPYENAFLHVFCIEFLRARFHLTYLQVGGNVIQVHELVSRLLKFVGYT